MTRQYIGARYVPKFFENPDGSNNWLNNVAYEPLTIVSYAGNSFTSKKPVPTGIDISNTEYWVSTGIYNTQVEEYRKEVLNLRTLDGYEKFSNKTICIIGDSFTDPAGNPHNWVYYLSEALSEFNVNIINKGVNGESFAGIASKISDGSFVIPSADYYILFLGLNDFQGQWSWIRGKQNSLLDSVDRVNTAIITANPLAERYYISPMKYFLEDTINNAKTPLLIYRSFYERFFSNNGYTVISGFNVPVFSSYNAKALTIDGLHPNDVLSKIMADYFLKHFASNSSTISTGASRYMTNIVSLLDGININVSVTSDFTLNLGLIGSHTFTSGEWVDLCEVGTWLPSGNGVMISKHTDDTNCQYRITDTGMLQMYFFEGGSKVNFNDRIIYGCNLIQNI